MSVQNSSGLASLTATYTDSEAEDDTGDISSPSPERPKPPPPVVVSPSVRSQNAKRLAQLVSYHDDTIVSDEEADGGVVSDDAMETKEEVEEKAEEEAEPEEEIEPTDGVKLPPEPQGHCSMALQDKIKKFHDRLKSNANFDMNKLIQDRKDFRNPSIYEKLVQFCELNELGTNYPPEIYNPLMWGKESYFEELAKVQKAETEKREKERKEKTKVEFVSGTAKRTAGVNLLSAEEEAKRRKSKWDQVGGVGGSVAAPVVRPVGLMQHPALTTSATGTKGTVISAFGSLPKKPKT
ncbi:SAP30-binding protein [Frankliniella fusca]|uniref:SAP30-binding protein n=1 Tax=Frankliniella fusca TaxID=407009 RepID=A0AAE1HP86_9NEOP|nr:SAP30-binding protein [Frankliniella fusca]